jgi:hypothetical protein
MTYRLRIIEIAIGYRVRLFRINFKMYQRLTRITLAGMLLKVAVWISSDLKKELGL